MESDKDLRKLLSQLNLPLGKLNEFIVNGIDEGIWITNSGGYTIYANPTFTQLLDIPLVTLREKHLIDVILFDDKTPSEIFLSPSSSDPHSRHEIKLLKNDKSTIWVMIGASPLFDENAKYLGSLFMVIDISQRKKAELENQNNQAKMETSARLASLGEMAGGVAHEINNPLMVIIGKARKARRLLKPDDENIAELTQALNDIESTGRRIEQIVGAMLKLSRNQQVSKQQETPIDEITSELLILVSERFRAAGIKINVTMPEKFTFECSPIQISQVLLNLFNNAFDAIKDLETKWVNLDIRKTESSAIITLTDSGPGIPAHLREKVMMPFFTTKAPGKGTGLGLSVSFAVIKDHEGSFEIDSTSPNTCFRITLPLHRGQALALARAA